MDARDRSVKPAGCNLKSQTEEEKKKVLMTAVLFRIFVLLCISYTGALQSDSRGVLILVMNIHIMKSECDLLCTFTVDS